MADESDRAARQKAFYTKQREEAERGEMRGDPAAMSRLQKIRSKLGAAGLAQSDADLRGMEAIANVRNKARKKTARQK